MSNDGSFWRINEELSIFPFKLKRIINYLDDTSSRPFQLKYKKGGLQPNSASASSTSSSSDIISSISASSPPSTPNTLQKTRFDRVGECLYSNSEVDLEKLRKLSWSGLPSELRGLSWRILMGYLPTNSSRHEGVLLKKRKEYLDIVMKYFKDETRSGAKSKGSKYEKYDDDSDPMYHQISIDVPRTCPECGLFQIPRIQKSLLRILYCWSIRRPATGYVQGINDLVTPFFEVFITEELRSKSDENESDCRRDIDTISDEDLFNIEADTFWCLSTLLDCIQDNYTFNQSGIYRQVSLIRKIVHRMDPPLVHHLEDSESVQFIQFAFRWINCLLLREFRLKIIERLWDSYLSDGPEGFKVFHPYVCAAFLLRFRRELQLLDFQDVVMFLQTPPTAEWSDKDIELLVAEAFVLKNLFHK